MGTYRVRVVRSPRHIRQRFHVRIESAENGRCLFTSENLRDHDYARELATSIARALKAEVVPE